MAAIPGVSGLKMIGRGGFSAVYVGTQDAFGRQVAAKVLSLHMATEEERLRFERECRAHGSLANHPNIVTVLAAGVTADEVPYLLLDYQPGGSLSDRISAGAVDLTEVVAVGVQIAGALDYAHRSGIIHRDVKPANILFDEFGRPSLGDFGISQIQGGYETRSGQLSASIAFAPPEVLGGGHGSAAGDVYSLAATLYAAVAGQPPFYRPGDDNLLALMSRIANDEAPDLGEHAVPEPVGAVIAQGMSKDPAARFASAAAFGAAIRDAGTSLGLSVPEMVLRADPAPALQPTRASTSGPEDTTSPDGTVDTEGPTERHTRARVDRRALAAGLASVAVLLILAAVLVRANGGDDADQGDAHVTTTPTTIEVSPDDVVLESAPEQLGSGVVAERISLLSAPEGSRAAIQVTVRNDGAEPVTIRRTEVVPKSLAPSADVIELLSDELTVVESDPVLGFGASLDAGASAVLAYRVAVDAGPVDEARLDRWEADRVTAEAEYLTAHPEASLWTVEPEAAGPPGSSAEAALAGSSTTSTARATGSTSGGGVPGGSGAGGEPGTTGTTAQATTPEQSSSTTSAVVAPGAPRNVRASDPAAESGLGWCQRPDTIRTTIGWSAPAVTGGAPVTDYVVVAALVDAGGTIESFERRFAGSVTSGSITVPRREADAYWVFTVVAANTAGRGPSTTAQPVMPDLTGQNFYTIYPLLRSVGLQVAPTFSGGPTTCQGVVSQQVAAGSVRTPGEYVGVTVEQG